MGDAERRGQGVRRPTLIDVCPGLFVAPEPARVAEVLTRYTADALACDRVAVYLVGGDGGLRLAHLHGGPAEHDGVETASWVHASGDPMLLPGTAGDARLTGPWSRAAGAVTVLGLPLPRDGRQAGVLVAARSAPPAFDVESLDVAAPLARQGALALENARLFAEQRAALSQLAELDLRRADHVAAITHDLQAPLTGLLGFVVTLKRVAAELTPDERASYLAAMERQIERAAGLVDDMLVGARLDAGDLGTDAVEDVDLAALASDVPELFGPDARRRVRVEMSEPVLVRGDRRQLERVLQNLIDNALEHTTAPSPVVVEVRREGAAAVLSVNDAGPGMPEEVLERLFERYGPRRGSHGLGLYIVRGIVAAHGGEVTVDSVAGRGTTFAVTLPLAERPPGAVSHPSDGSGGHPPSPG